jgi:hypothetical protein
MKKLTIISIIIIILGGVGYYLYLTDSLNLNFLKKNSSEQAHEIKDEEVKASNIWAPISGDFNGDGKKEIATSTLVKKGVGSPMDGGTVDEYEIQFSDKTIPPITKVSMGREVAIINEGDLNNDSRDDISTYTHPLNGFHDIMRTYSLLNNKWIEIVPEFSILTGEDYLNYEELQKMVFKEGDSIYYYDEDLNSDSGKLIKKKITPITGNWSIKSFSFTCTKVCAMDEKEASQWVGKNLFIDNEKISFDFSKIPGYKDIFKSNTCTILNLNNPEVVLNSVGFKYLEYKTDCQTSPFSEFSLTEDGNIEINLDGVEFTLVKK